MYRVEGDYWAIGIVAFALLSGTMPFYADDKGELMDQIDACEYHLFEEDWEHISDEAKHFVKRILIKTPEYRMNL